MYGFTEVAAIVVICYLIGMCLKILPAVPDKAIPVLVGICGLILGIVAYIATPEIMATDNIFDAAAIGIVSGLASTGINQIGKQLTKEE